VNYDSGKIDYGKVKIYALWIIKHCIIFLSLSLFVHPIIASAASLIITIALFFHPDNYKQVERCKRPVIWIKRMKNVH